MGGVGGGDVDKTIHSENHNPSLVFAHWGFVDSKPSGVPADGRRGDEVELGHAVTFKKNKNKNRARGKTREDVEQPHGLR